MTRVVQICIQAKQSEAGRRVRGHRHHPNQSLSLVVSARHFAQRLGLALYIFFDNIWDNLML